MLRFFKREKNTESLDKDINWNSNRYSTVIAQRNILLLFTLILLVAISVSILAIFKISTSSTIEPFVIEIDKKSGIVQLVDPVTVKQYSADEVLNNYFISEYIKAREVFDSYNYNYNYYTKVRLFSSPNVYSEFSNYIKSQNMNDLFNLYSDAKGELKIRSIQKLGNDALQVRFSIEFTRKDGNSSRKNKIVVMSYKYASLEMNDQQRYINPLGFQVISYRVDDEYV
ncbi:VirB8 [Wolbachia endosymbiont of Armadillidium vulgare str. wVulC]|uniref:VirB8 n=2 Tax=unclassified Wolbachia TaxID=2640676 RepID=Q52SJ7_9RICK|nr:type IV secretion system protein [Wolbachia endosymbiont of Armadillidium vulgare]AAX86705.1 VirB8 [Wolbachia endosymbiont of Armadillidium vulgare]ACO52153.1 VirB8 [Wolbachia endosymbiont of Armadillidium vulgare str. wVulC]KLT22652.1 VirB8 [Wolbachia endosymbiont of Armadillidium vulgare str. wVulC]